MRFQREFGLNDYDVSVLTAERGTAEFFESCVQAGGEPKRLCNLLTQVGLKIAHEKACAFADLGLDAGHTADLAGMIEKGDINTSAGNVILEKMVETGQAPQALAESLDLLQQSDAGELEAIVKQVIESNEQAVQEVKTGGKKSKKAHGFLMGQVMQKTKGQANPKVVSEILSRMIS
jgi:aspartyl-tRNA(Asn)/glutamyl-tRNA(Gln) amidotransferase subunit B